jgi:hypothetical protein
MGFSVQKLTKPLIAAATAIVLLGAGTGAAMAATSDGSQHQLTRKQLCTRGQFEEKKAVAKEVAFEYVLQGVEGVTIGTFTIPDAVLSGGGAAILVWETTQDLKYCSGPEKKMPKPKLPPFLQHIPKNEYGGGDE